MERKKVLVGYATRYGSARFVAEDLESHLRTAGADPEVVNLRKQRPSRPLGDYDTVVVGSSVAMFSWTGAAKGMLKKCRRAGIRPVVYITCGTDIESPDMARIRFLDKVINRLGVEPVLAETISPVLDFRPGVGISDGVKKRIRGTIQAVAKDSFKEDGLMDLRNPARFDKFLTDVNSVVTGSGT